MRQGWIAGLTPRVAKNGKAYVQVAILDSTDSRQSSYNWFRGTGTLRLGDAVEYDWQTSQDGRYQNLVVLGALAMEAALRLGSMPVGPARADDAELRRQGDPNPPREAADDTDATELELEKHAINAEARVTEARRLALGCATALAGNITTRGENQADVTERTVTTAKRFEAWLRGQN